jgi:phosphoribosylformylglycinamidine (FGAM) synthase-like enzyme
MAFAGGIGLAMDMDAIKGQLASPAVACFSQSASRYLLEVSPDAMDALYAILDDLPHCVIGTFDDTHRLHSTGLDVPLQYLHDAWANGLGL